MKLALLLLLAQAPAVTLKPWEQGSLFSAADRAAMELRFQVTEAAPQFRLQGVQTYDREQLSLELLLGDLLFHAPKLLGPRAAVFGLSCSTCHPGGAAHNTLFVEAQSDRPGNVDLLSAYFYAAADDGAFAPRNITSLRGCAATGPYRRDGTVSGLAEANALVVQHEFQQRAPQRWLDALSAFVARLELPAAPPRERSALEREGERVFDAPRPGLEGRACSSCHPKERAFTDGQQHALRHGDGEGTLGKTVRFDTPTLLGAAETAPYFFDGSAPTFEAAVRQLDRRHGLKLSPAEQAALAAYLLAVGAAPPGVTWPPRERVRQALAWGRLLEGDFDPALWPVCLDAMRLQARLAGDERLAAELAALAKRPPGPQAALRLSRLRIGRRAAAGD